MAKAVEKKKNNTQVEHLTIPPPRFQVAQFQIIGTAPLVLNKFSQKAKAKMRADQEAGSTKKKGAKKEAKDFQSAYLDAMYVSSDGWHGIPATAFRNACVSACRMCGFKMTHAKLSIFIEADGVNEDDATALVKITKGKPEYFETAVRNASGVCDLRPRPMWRPGWEAKVRIRFDADQFTLPDVANLLLRAGMQVGVGEGRPDSRQGCGMGWGVFRISEKDLEAVV